MADTDLSKACDVTRNPRIDQSWNSALPRNYGHTVVTVTFSWAVGDRINGVPLYSHHIEQMTVGWARNDALIVDLTSNKTPLSPVCNKYIMKSGQLGSLASLRILTYRFGTRCRRFPRAQRVAFTSFPGLSFSHTLGADQVVFRKTSTPKVRQGFLNLMQQRGQRPAILSFSFSQWSAQIVPIFFTICSLGKFGLEWVV